MGTYTRSLSTNFLFEIPKCGANHFDDNIVSKPNGPNHQIGYLLSLHPTPLQKPVSCLSGRVVDLVAHNGGGDEEDEDNMSRSWQGR